MPSKPHVVIGQIGGRQAGKTLLAAAYMRDLALGLPIQPPQVVKVRVDDCPECGGRIEGDGFTEARVCENAERLLDREPDARVLTCSPTPEGKQWLSKKAREMARYKANKAKRGLK